jgi:NIMA (never in mitosis gene a)-related kinase
MPDCEARKTMMEIELLNSIKQAKSKYIIGYVDAFIYESAVNIVFEYCGGGDLASYIDKRKANPQFILERNILKFFLQICLGVHSLHSEGILHRDLKSLNVFLTADGIAKIGDLGCSIKAGDA